ncbi:hypothetical protein JCM14469_11230 [Desulfatiferula olefinivorans]
MHSNPYVTWPAAVVFAFILGWSGVVGAGPLSVTDDTGNVIRFDEPPRKVVCLVPSAAEMIFALGADSHVIGLTVHSGDLQGAVGKQVVGGFTRPSFDKVTALGPDLIIASSFQKILIDRIGDTVPVCVLDTRMMNDAFRHLEMMGTLFDRGGKARALIDKNRRQLEVIARKTASIPVNKRLRVMRLMGRDQVMTPGNDSFQNEMIRAAGGIAPDFGKAGNVVPVTPEEFSAFNPQVIYGCGDDLTTAGSLFEREGFRDADAVRNGRLLTFPCGLTCRSGVHLGDFVSWLSARIYAEEFADSARNVLPRAIVENRPMDLSFDHVNRARVAVGMIDDFENKTLIIDFKTPRTVVSTLDGLRSGVVSVGNHYSPPPCWSLTHGAGLDDLRGALCRVIGKDPEKSVFLFTGADMDHLSVKTERFKTMTVTALVTAGVRGNAMRMGTDSGDYFEPGTINVIVLSNMALSVRAMTRAIITATEAKTAALWDLDVRSSYAPLSASATGTGTDNILVAPGDGALIDNAGGHSKMGELIARAVYAGVREAVARQNGLEGGRDVFQRLEERRVSVSSLVDGARCLVKDKPADLHVRLERLLLDPAYAGVVENALGLSDDLARGAVSDLSVFERTCLFLASRIAGKTLDHTVFDLSELDLPVPLSLAVNALLSGAVYQAPPADGPSSEDCPCR